MSSHEEIFSKLKRIIADKVEGVDPDRIRPDATIIGDIGADSLGVVEIVIAIEKEFGLEIPDADADKIQTVLDAIQYIENHQ